MIKFQLLPAGFKKAAVQVVLPRCGNVTTGSVISSWDENHEHVAGVRLRLT